MKLVGLILQILWHWTALFKGCDADASWNNFASSPGYENSQLVVPGNLFHPRYIPKGSSLIWARMDCSRSCATNDACLAFNFYENEMQYICELLSVNLCRNQNALMLTNQSRGSVWDKLTTGMKTSCYEMLPKAKLNCTIVRPGCLGTVPNCFNCTKTCIDIYNRYGSIKDCTLWPDGDAPTSVPVAGRCYIDSTILLVRKIDMATRTELPYSYRMAFGDIYRIFRLKAYRLLKFYFGSTFGYASIYSNGFIDSNGTLSNWTFVPTPGIVSYDIFNLKGQAMKPTRFVNVTDDRYNCGSFWLIDNTNATYCPGGEFGMFGALKVNSTTVLSTGMRIPAAYSSAVVTSSFVSLIIT